jgi:hypothetical protein
MLEPTLRERRWDCQRPSLQVEHLVADVEPDVLPAADLPGEQDQSRRVLGSTGNGNHIPGSPRTTSTHNGSLTSFDSATAKQIIAQPKTHSLNPC